MTAALIVRLRPLGPWRSGPDSGARERVDLIYHSDTLYAAVTSAMASLGWLEEWLEATARRESGSAVRFSSCFPLLGETRYVVPPQTVWPPAGSSKVRWKGARFVPLDVIEALLGGEPINEDRWAVDGESQCLVRPGEPGPFRIGLRNAAAVDRVGGGIEPHRTACLEFSDGCGLWALAAFDDEAARERWCGRVQSALRLLADSGFGGERSRGWGRADAPEFLEGELAALLLPRVAAPAPDGDGFWGASERSYWLLSLFAPAPGDPVEWGRGHYTLVTRSGHSSGSEERNKSMNMIVEGSVVVASGEVRGAAADVAPEGHPHPVYRAGFAVALALPAQAPS
ncbi:MAG: type III-A CRISPR-associated RAMP protein Csm4 [Bryobacteraceae bacterium]